MKKKVFGRQLNRTKNQRRALFRGLITALIEKGELVTTLAKAKAIRGQVEKLVTKARRGTVADGRVLFRYLGKRDLVNRLIKEIAVVFKNRPGGYLRLVRLPAQRGNNAVLAKLIFSETIAKSEIVNQPEAIAEKVINPETAKKKLLSPTKKNRTKKTEKND